MNPPIGAGAIFSPDRKYRFALWRRWDFRLPMAMFIGLNPSTANEKKTDPTITRLVGIPGKPGLAPRNGFGGFYMMNLYPFVTPHPEELETSADKIFENDLHIYDANMHCDTVVFCWGNFNTFGRDAEVMQMFRGAMCFGKNKSGSPKHPLYLAGDTKLIDY